MGYGSPGYTNGVPGPKRVLILGGGVLNDSVTMLTASENPAW